MPEFQEWKKAVRFLWSVYQIEYYSTTYNIYKSSSWQLPKDVRKTPLQTGKGCETWSLRDSVVFAEDCSSGFMVHIFSSETLETSKLARL